MAQVTSEVQARIDRYLDYLCAEWASIPHLAREWSELEYQERMDFILEWPIKEDRLVQLRDHADRGLLTPAQRARYDNLLKLVTEHRPTLERLLAD